MNHLAKLGERMEKTRSFRLKRGRESRNILRDRFGLREHIRSQQAQKREGRPEQLCDNTDTEQHHQARYGT